MTKTYSGLSEWHYVAEPIWVKRQLRYVVFVPLMRQTEATEPPTVETEGHWIEVDAPQITTETPIYRLRRCFVIFRSGAIAGSAVLRISGRCGLIGRLYFASTQSNVTSFAKGHRFLSDDDVSIVSGR